MPEITDPKLVAELDKQAGAPQSSLGDQAVAIAGSFSRGGLEGVPIVGPALRSAGEHIAAGAESLLNDTPYDLALQTAQLKSKNLSREHPVAETAGEVAGGIGSMAGLGATATGAKLLGLGGETLLGTMARSAASGGVIGAADSAVRGEDPVTGGGLGAIVGGVSPALGRVASTIAAPVTKAIRGALNPVDEAARRVASALSRDTKAGTAGLTEAEFSAAQTSGQPVAVIDRGGETTRALARSSANTSPEGRAELNRGINDRFESQSDRVGGWLNKTFGPSDTGATRESMQDAARVANRPAYAKAYSEGSRPLWSEELQRLVGSPDVVDAMRTAAAKGKSRAIADGFGGFNSPVQVSDSGTVTFARGKGGVPTYPDLQFWDYTRRELSNAAEAAKRTGSDQAGTLGTLAKKLNAELDTLIPSYGAARAGAARHFGAQDALEAGEKFLAGNMPINDARRAFAALSAPEKDLFREGFVQSLTTAIERTPDRRNLLNKLAQSPYAQQQVSLVMGTQRAREYEAMLRVEGIMDLARPAVQGNSTTARQLAELGLAGGVNVYEGGGSLTTDPAAVTKALLVYGAARGHRVVDERVAQQVARLLASGNQADLARGVKLLAGNNTMFNTIRNADVALAAIAARGAARPVSEKLGVQ